MDGNELVDYSDDSYSYAGCETCDYGSEYINEISIETTNSKIYAEFNQMYEHAISQADMIKAFMVDIRKMTEDDFVKYITDFFLKYKDIGLTKLRVNDIEVKI